MTPREREVLARIAGGASNKESGRDLRISPRTIKTCLERGWAEPWFSNPLKPDWLVCKLTAIGRRIAEGG